MKQAKRLYTFIQYAGRGRSRLRVVLSVVWEQSTLYRKSLITLRWYLLSLTYVSTNSSTLTMDTRDTGGTWHNLVVVTLEFFVTRMNFSLFWFLRNPLWKAVWCRYTIIKWILSKKNQVNTGIYYCGWLIVTLYSDNHCFNGCATRYVSCHNT